MKEKQVFDVHNQEHLKLYKMFSESSSWGKDGCPFVLQWPWVSVPDMIKHQITAEFLKGVN